MNKLEVGMYVRTKKGISKIIGRVNNPSNYFYKFWKCDIFLELYDDTEYICDKDIIGEPSYNITDLIEVGDYVNGLKVDFIKDGYIVGNYDYDCWNSAIQIKIKDIKSIVTKEQFESMEYKVGGNNE